MGKGYMLSKEVGWTIENPIQITDDEWDTFLRECPEFNDLLWSKGIDGYDNIIGISIEQETNDTSSYCLLRWITQAEVNAVIAYTHDIPKVTVDFCAILAICNENNRSRQLSASTTRILGYLDPELIVEFYSFDL